MKRKRRTLSLVLVMALIIQSFLGLDFGLTTKTVQAQAPDTAINLEEAVSELFTTGGLVGDANWAGTSAELSEEGTNATITTTDSAGGFGWGNPWGMQYILHELPVIKGSIYTLEFDIVSTIDKKLTVKLDDTAGVIFEEYIELTANIPYHFSQLASAQMPANTTDLFFAMGYHDGEDVNRQGEITISNVKLINNTPAEATPIAINRDGSRITFQKSVAILDPENSVTVYYDIFNTEELANAVDDYCTLTQTADMVKVSNNALWQVREELAMPLTDGQACRYAFVTNTGEEVSELATYVFEEFTPVDYTTDTLDRDGMTLVWQDEFDGDELDLTKWSYQIGTKAPGGPDDWGNEEAQYYTDKNHELKDGKLVITAKKEAKGGKAYTSTRIRTVTDDGQDLFTTTYGRVEARMKLPIEEGTWPAFWMLPEDGSIYNGWAASGELDIMEARGRVPNEVGGAIHYGSQWPGNTYHGKSYQFDDEVTDISAFHLYSVEWEPGKITWLVDDEEYYSTSNWYSKTIGNAEDFTYGAPFDTPYYILLNLAVGGTFDGNANLANAEFPASMEVDYVRVFQKDGGYDDEDLVKPDIGKDTEAFATEAYQPTGSDGDYIKDTAFTTLTTQAIDPYSSDWQFTTGFNGEATQSVVDIDGTKYAKIDITAAGNQNYAVQLIKHMPFAQGYTYRVSFDAKADTARDIVVKPCGDDDNGWAAYSKQDFTLSNVISPYEFEFTMGSDSDPTARLEFNLGLNTTNVYIGNVVVKKVEPNEGEVIDKTDMKKVPLTGLMSGEQIYNGTFDQGTRRLAFWHTNNTDAYVPSFVGTKDYSRRVQLTATGSNPSIYQKGIELLQSDQYEISFDLSSESNTSVELVFENQTGTKNYLKESFSYNTSDGIKTYKTAFAMPMELTDTEAVFRLKLTNGSTISLDNISLKRKTSNNTSVDYSDVELKPIPLNSEEWSGVDITEGEQDITEVSDCISLETVINNANYQRMLLHSVSLKAGVRYKLQFSYKADDENTYGLSIQEDNSWATTYENLNLNTTTEWQNYEADFTSTLTNTGNPIILKFLLSGPDVTPGRFYLKDISLVAIPEESAGDAPADTITAASQITPGSSLKIQVKEGDWRNDFMTAVENGNAVIMINELSLTNRLDLTTMIDSDLGTISIPAEYLSTAGKTYQILLAIGGYKTITVNTKVISNESGDTPSGGSTEPPKDIIDGNIMEKLEKQTENGQTVAVVDKKGEYDFSDTNVTETIKVVADEVVIKNITSEHDVVLEGKNIIVEQANLEKDLEISGRNAKLTDSVVKGDVTLSGAVSEVKNTTVEGTFSISGNKSIVNNVTIKNDFVIGKELKNGEIRVRGTKISGKVTINGGGRNSVYFTDTTANTVVINKKANAGTQSVRLVLEGNTKVKNLNLQSKAFINSKGIKNSITNLIVGKNASKSTVYLTKADSVTKYTLTNGAAIRVKAASGSLSLKSTNKKIAAVSKAGNMKAYKKGNAKINITLNNKKVVAANVIVK